MPYPTPQLAARNADILQRWRKGEARQSLARRFGLSTHQISHIIRQDRAAQEARERIEQWRAAGRAARGKRISAALQAEIDAAKREAAFARPYKGPM